MSLLTKKDHEAIRSSLKSLRDILDEEYTKVTLGTWEQFNKYRKNGEFCDVEIVCRDGVLHSHKCILSASTLYFETLFSSPLSATEGKQRVHFDSYSVKTVNSILEYIYNYYLYEIDESVNVEELLQVAEFIHLDLLVKELVDSIRHTVDESNCLEWCEVSKSCGVEKGFVVARSFIIQNYDNLIKQHGGAFSAKIQDVISVKDELIFQKELVFGLCYESKGEPVYPIIGWDSCFCVIDTSAGTCTNLNKLYGTHGTFWDQSSTFRYFSFFVYDLDLIAVCVDGLYTCKDGIVINQWACLEKQAKIILCKYDQIKHGFDYHPEDDLQIEISSLFPSKKGANLSRPSTVSHRTLASVFYDGVNSLYLVICEWSVTTDTIAQSIYKIFKVDLKGKTRLKNWITIVPKSKSVVLAESKTFGTILIDGLTEIYLAGEFDFRSDSNSSNHTAISLDINLDAFQIPKRIKLDSDIADDKPWSVITYNNKVYMLAAFDYPPNVHVYVLDEQEKCWVPYCTCAVPKLWEIDCVFKSQGKVFVNVMVSDVDEHCEASREELQVEVHRFDVEGKSIFKTMDLPHKHAISVIPEYFLF